MVFSPDGTRLAITYGDYTNHTSDLRPPTGSHHRPGADGFPVITRLKFTANGEALMLYMMDNQAIGDGMSAGPPLVLLLDAADLSPRWSTELVGVRDGCHPTDERDHVSQFL
jgi:hypothetical protein